MEKIEFKTNIWRTGNTRVITVPNQYIKDGYIDTDLPVTVSIANEECPSQE